MTTVEQIVELSGQYNDGLITDLEYRNRLAAAITELNESETEILSGVIVLGWKEGVL